MKSLVECTKAVIAIAVAAGVAAKTAINGAIVDTLGFDGLLVQVTTGAIVSGAVTSIKIQTGDESDLSDAVDVAGSSVTIEDTDASKIFAIDIRRPLKRYARVVVSRGTQNATIENATYLLYDAKVQPVSDGFEDSAKVANL